MLLACSTEKNAWINRAFHNVNSRYNGYYHANQSLEQGIFTLKTSHKDDLSQLLSVFPYGDESNRKGIFGQMDKAIEKATKVVAKHSMIHKIRKEKREVTNWVDNSYLVIGKAHLFKAEYGEAHKVFEYIEENFYDMDSRFDAKIWDIQTYLFQENYTEAYRLIKNLEEEEKFPKELVALFNAVKADYFIKNEELGEAIASLEMATIHEKKKGKRVRYTYLLAQLNEQLGNQREAVKYYEQVIKLNPPYEFSFQAKINMALGYSGGDNSKIKTVLNKMVKDEKNKEYLDQIYFALANLELNEGNLEAGKEYLKLSAVSSVENKDQKSQSYLQLGDIYFAEPEYFMAFAYYDTCVKVLPRDYAEYDVLVDKRDNLKDLVQHYKVIEEEDSLQNLVNMSEDERNELIDKMIEAYIEKKEDEADAKEQETLLALNNNGTVGGNNSGGAWYFSNQSAVAQGRSEFMGVFGDRALEDNWRRLDKSSAGDFGGPDIAQTGQEEGEIEDFSEDEEAQRDYYLAKLPMSDSAYAASVDRLLDAYFKLGMVYLEGLQNRQLALQTFEELLKRSEDSQFDAQSRYILYRLNKQLSNLVEASKYERSILSKHPETEYAKIISNPNYFKELEKAKNEANRYYQQLYNWYQNEDYSSVVNQGELLYEKYKDTKVAPRILLLVVMAQGTVIPQEEFVKKLKNIQMIYPETSASEDAGVILLRISNSNRLDKKKAQKEFESNSLYKLDRMDLHNVIIMLDSEKANVSDFKGEIADFNTEFFKLIPLQVKSIVWKGNEQMIIVSGIPTAEKAEQYYKAIQSEGFMDVVKNNGSLYFITSQVNFKTLMKERNLSDYMEFFLKSYRMFEEK
ncbi:tetratricopeptide repeat protein [Flavobacteriales bacterium]|nr:tetratricopeptide repeat protein [Flavobacteriales bacterium]